MRAAIEEANATPDADTINFNIGGTGNLGNTSSGVLVSFEGANNTIGSNGAARNTIAFNGQDGVEISGAGVTGNSILRNSIFSNAGLGIDLGANGRTANDPGDADTGPNNLQNFPVLTSAETVGATTTIKGRLNSTPPRSFWCASSPTLRATRARSSLDKGA